MDTAPPDTARIAPAITSGKRTIVVTATKALQDQLFHRDLPLLGKAIGRPVTAALLKGRANYLCVHRLDLVTEPAAALAAAGHPAGMFTSPHLVRPNERIRIAGEDIAADEFHRRLDGMRTLIASAKEGGRLETLDVSAGQGYVIPRGTWFKHVAEGEVVTGLDFGNFELIDKSGTKYTDPNGDGDISPREFLGTPDQYQRLDRDNDGFIDDPCFLDAGTTRPTWPNPLPVLDTAYGVRLEDSPGALVDANAICAYGSVESASGFRPRSVP